MKTLLFTILYGCTILSAQLFINEIDYDQSGSDHDEFIEIAGPAGTYYNVTIDLINGNDNTSYETVQISSLTLTDQTDGYGFYAEYISAIQNGAPDGVQLSVDDVIVDAVAYEGSMNDTDGNAMEEAGEDYQTSSEDQQSLSRLGLDGTPWQELTITPGAINTNQVMSDEIEIQGCTDDTAYNYNPDATVDDGTCLYYDVVTIAAARALGVDIPVIVQGTVTSPCFHADNADYTFQDATAGINLFGFNLSVLGLNVGDEIKVSGITDEYNGKFEVVISSADDIELLSTGNSVTPQVITVSDLYTNGEAYESELITIEDVEPSGGDSWPNEGSYANITITDNNGVSITTMRIDDDTDIDGSPEPNWPLDVTGVGGQYDFEEPYDEFYQIIPRSIEDFQGEPGMPVANAGPDQVVDSGDLVTLDGSASFDENGTILYYEWVQTGGGTVALSCTDDCENGISTFTAPIFDDELVFRLTVWDNEFNEDLDEITITVSAPITIYDIQYTTEQGEFCYETPMIGETVTTSGIVTAIKPGDYPNFYLSDPTLNEWGGIYVYDVSVDPQIGDEITLTASVNEYYSMTQLIDVISFSSEPSGNPPTPVFISTGDLGIDCSFEGEAFEGMLVKVSNVIIDHIDEFGNWYVNDGSGQVIVDDYIFDGDWPTVSIGDSYDAITGVVEYSYNEYKILPRVAVDICTADCGDDECGAELGDVNGDGNYDVLDIVTLANCVLAGDGEGGCASIENACAADLNGDGSYNVLDIVNLANCILEDCGGRIDDASHSKIIMENNMISIEADGFIGGVQMTLKHGNDFSIEMTDRALLADYLTNGNETRLLVITPETEELFSYSGDFEITEVIVANTQYEVLVDLPVVTKISVSDAYPNPFNPTTTMMLTVSVSGDIQVEVYNLLGQYISTLINGYKESGTYNLTWDASDVSSGMYFVKAQADGFTAIQKLMLIK